MKDNKKNNDPTSPYQLFNFGPMLCKMKLDDANLKKYTKFVSKKTSFINETLAGVIKHEHSVDLQKYGEIINPYLSIFYEGFQRWYGIRPPSKLLLTRAWANFMVAAEFNPPHTHPNCDFSSVLFVKIPKELKEEHKKFKGTGAGPGALSFFYGGNQNFSICYMHFFPEEGDFFMFPASLTHFVSPFTSGGERISLSANFSFDFKRK